jgi:hypothetical protein
LTSEVDSRRRSAAFPPGYEGRSQKGWLGAVQHHCEEQKVQGQGRAQPCSLAARNSGPDGGKHFDLTWGGVPLKLYTGSGVGASGRVCSHDSTVALFF